MNFNKCIQSVHLSKSPNSSLDDRSRGQEHLGLSFRRGSHTSHPEGLSKGLWWSAWVAFEGNEVANREIRNSWSVSNSLAGNLCPPRYFTGEKSSWKGNANQGPGVWKEEGFVASLSWAERSGNISSMKPPSKALLAFLSTPGEPVHLEKDTWDKSYWLSWICVHLSLLSLSSASTI